MNIGIPRERRPFEFRVGLSPAGVEILRQHGHTVYVEDLAGVGAGFDNQEYEQAGARIAFSPEEVFGRADLLLKVARPLEEELNWLQDGCTLAGFLHLAPAQRSKIDLLLQKKITALAYEQIRLPDATLPVLRPFSQIGGLMAAQTAARLLQNSEGGKGILIGGVPGVPPAEVVILGGGVVGTYAAQAFVGLGAHVVIVDRSVQVLQHLADRFPGIVTMLSTQRNLERVTAYADVLVGAVLLRGQRTPILVTREMVRAMKPRSIIIDVSIDEGGCVETSRPTTHDAPTFFEEGVLHYCVPNMPGVVARTATHAFVNAALPYVLAVADRGVGAAMQDDPAIESAVAIYQGNPRHLTLVPLGKEASGGLDRPV
ncbi:MAG TPA: alanine dehydrogenase [Anaerolineales bacterium]|jgi:alanine dehydrogenase